MHFNIFITIIGFPFDITEILYHAFASIFLRVRNARNGVLEDTITAKISTLKTVPPPPNLLMSATFPVHTDDIKSY